MARSATDARLPAAPAERQDHAAPGPGPAEDTFAILRRELDTTPHEFVANAGDVLIWHPLLFHSATVNPQADTRIALFGRWGVALHDEPVFDFAGDKWSSWEFTAPAMSS